MQSHESRLRVIIEGVEPQVDGGRFPIKRTVGERVVVQADIFANGQDVLNSTLLYRAPGSSEWQEAPMTLLNDDRWQGEFTVSTLGRYLYTIQTWVDRFLTWRRDTQKKADAGLDVSAELLMAAELVDQASTHGSKADAARLQAWAEVLRGQGDRAEVIELALGEALDQLMGRYPDRQSVTTYQKELSVVVDRELARFSTWYELFPRSTSPHPDQAGTFRDCETRLPYLSAMGFNVLYLPPIHPIGRTGRKGRNNALMVQPGDPGSPWAIGSAEGGHKAVHPELGTLEDFRRFVAKASEHGVEVALDVAFQCSPDHPYVKEHPEWFRRRPDGSIQYAENPPKKYEDTYPLDFETAAWRELWEELRSVFLFWIEQGVHIFRVDNPHTKSFRFWEWLIGSVKETYPDVIFLSEAFTRPKVMYYLAKLGFTQSYTYFTWKNTKAELTQYFTEVTQSGVPEFFRPNLWPNTPDILHDYLQNGGRPAFAARLVLAGTLGASYGIYGPAYELGSNTPREGGSEEYLNSEKYEVKHWDWDSSPSLKDLISRLNKIRTEHPALQRNEGLRFHSVANEQIICYSKGTGDFADVILTVVNLDPRHTQSGWVDLSLEAMGLASNESYQVQDLLTDARYDWQGPHNYVELNPLAAPAHIFCIQRRRETKPVPTAL